MFDRFFGVFEKGVAVMSLVHGYLCNVCDDKVDDKCFVWRKGEYRYIEHTWKSFETPKDQPHRYDWDWSRCSGCGQIRRRYGT